MLPLAGALLVAAGLLAIDRLLLQSAVGSAFSVLVLTIGTAGFTGAAYGYLRMRRKGGARLRPTQLALRAALIGIPVGFAQSWLRYGIPDILFHPWTGFMYSGAGALITHAVAKIVKTRRDPGRERRYLRALRRHAEEQND